MALTPGGRSPSTQPPPSPPPIGPNRSSRDGRPSPPPPSPQVAAIAVLRWGVLIGGLVLIADLGSQAISQRVNSQDVITTVDLLDYVINIVLFSIVGAVVVRETGQVYLGSLAGTVAGLVDGVVVATAASMAPPRSNFGSPEEAIVQNVILGTVFATISAAVGRIIQRRAGRSR